MAVTKIRETFVNETEGYQFGDSDWYAPYTADRGELFRKMQREYGRCISAMYRDRENAPPVVTGWVFQKRDKYEDNPSRTYLREVWVEVSES